MGKALATKSRIVEQALRLSSLVGLEGLTLGNLASELRLSKSGLYAHFGSKESLQLEVMQRAAEHFIEVVWKPAIAAPRGRPRVRALFEHWLEWAQSKNLPGGCIFIAAAAELDDRPGPVRDALVATQRQWLDSLSRACNIAREEGHYRADVDPDQAAFEMHAIFLAYHFQARLLGAEDAADRARVAFDDLDRRSIEPSRSDLTRAVETDAESPMSSPSVTPQTTPSSRKKS